MSFLEARHLYGRGIGWVDAHLLASTLLTGCAIWTFDKPLRRAAMPAFERLGVKIPIEITRRLSES